MPASRNLPGFRLLGALLLLLSIWGLRAQPAANNQPRTTNNEPTPNRVLDLDGNGSYVELPPNIFNDLDEATVEAWVRWDTTDRNLVFDAPRKRSGWNRCAVW